MIAFDDFERRARTLWEEIPDDYKAGVDGLVVSEHALPHPALADVYTLGECRTEAYPSDFAGPETVRSVVALYHGSFERLAALDPEFDWEDELWETLTHELKHHLEWLADEDALERVDYAADENFKRLHGEPFDPYFYGSGEPVAEGVWRIERDFFLVREYREPSELGGGAQGDDGGAGDEVAFTWHGARHRVPRPERLGDVCFLRVTGAIETGPAALWLVLVRRRGWWATVRALVGGEPPVVVEGEAAVG